MSRSHRRTERGYVTAELALCLPVVMVLLLAGMFALTALAAQLRCVDAARETALAAARGESGAGGGLEPSSTARIAIRHDADTVTAEVTDRVEPPGGLLPALTVRGTAIAAVEPGVR